MGASKHPLSVSGGFQRQLEAVRSGFHFSNMFLPWFLSVLGKRCVFKEQWRLFKFAEKTGTVNTKQSLQFPEMFLPNALSEITFLLLVLIT